MVGRSLAVMLLTVAAGWGVALGQGAGRDITVEAMRGERRVALVIGNDGAYPSSPLKNPANDARDMARTLRALGFDVMAHENLNQRDMKLVVTEFGRRLRGSDVGLFFFAGHGMQVGGRNFLVPIDAAPNSEDEVDADSLDVASVLSRMAGARNRLNIVVPRRLPRQPVRAELPVATSPGKVARDGDGKHGLYTGELLKLLPTPGLKLEDVFKRVREAVQRATNHDQVPWEASSGVGEFMFALPARGSEGSGPRVAVVTPPAAPAPPRVDSPGRNPTGPTSGDRRVLRGASWPFDPIYLRSSYRNYNPPDLRSSNIGFRCTRGLLP